MDRTKFEYEIEKLFGYFRLKEPEGYASIVYDEIDFIPDAAIGWICRHIRDNYDSMPRNLGKAFKAGWQLYRKSNPQKCARASQRTACSECNGKGLIWARKPDDGLGGAYTRVFRCACCLNWRRHLGEAVECRSVTKVQLRQNGYEIAFEVGPGGIPTTRSLTEMVDGIG